MSTLVLAAMIRFVWIAILMSWCSLLNGQQDSTMFKQRWSFGISAPHFGFIAAHNKQMTHLIQGHSFGFHTSAFKRLTGKKYWHQAYNFPESGVDFTYINTGNALQLGNQFALTYFLNLPLNRRQIKHDSNKFYKNWLGLGIGLGYATRIWDLRENHQAAVIGSHVNIALNLQYSARIVQFNSSEIRAGLRITHFSNGAFKIPNLGTNNVGVFLSYVFKEKKQSVIKPEISQESYIVNQTSLFAGAGLKEVPPPGGKKHAAFTLSLLREKRISYKSSFGLGIDAFYNSSIKAILEQKEQQAIKPNDVFQMGAVLSYTLHFDQFELKMQQGIYLHDKYKLDGRFYNRFGLRYRINSNWFAQLTLKTHFAKADFGEWGFGYAF